ncbi:hypothetical protein Tco_0016409 [Tanacetum coccineum]
MNDELQPRGIEPEASKSLTYDSISCSRVIQCFLKNLKVNPSGPGALELPQFHTASLISSGVKGLSRRNSWGMSSFARALIDLRVDVDSKEIMVVVVPRLDETVLLISMMILAKFKCSSNRNGGKRNGRSRAENEEQERVGKPRSSNNKKVEDKTDEQYDHIVSLISTTNVEDGTDDADESEDTSVEDESEDV